MSGDVETPTPGEISLKLVRGDTQFHETTVEMTGDRAPYRGHYGFDSVLPGTYNIVANGVGVTKTSAS